MAHRKIRIGEREGCRWADLSPDKSIRLPNSCTTGGSKWKASRGDVVAFKLGEETRLGRVLGAVVPCSPMPDDKCREFVAVMMLSENGSHCFPMWIPPADVTDCYHPENDSAAFAAWFFGRGLDAEDPARLMRQSRAGALTVYHFHNRETYR